MEMRKKNEMIPPLITTHNKIIQVIVCTDGLANRGVGSLDG